MHINPAGTVTKIDVVKSTGSPLLDSSVITDFKRWRFKPGTASRWQFPVSFSRGGGESRNLLNLR
jgi:TonB family protein